MNKHVLPARRHCAQRPAHDSDGRSAQPALDLDERRNQLPGADLPKDAGVVGEPFGGGDTDVIQDPAGDIFQTDLWLADTTTRVSTDGGQTWLSDVFSHTSPGDDRPWLAYSGPANSIFMVYDGLDAVHVARSSLAGRPQGGIAFVQDVPAVPECLTA